jgi:hypothetical protein
LKAQKNRRNGEGRSEKEAENGKKTNATGKPLSHSIENILGPNESSNDDGKRASMLALASESKMNGKDKKNHSPIHRMPLNPHNLWSMILIVANGQFLWGWSPQLG